MISISARRSLNAVDEEKVNKDLVAEIEIIMTDFSSDEWDIFRQSKGPWNNDDPRKRYRNYTIVQLIEIEKKEME